MNNGLIIFTSVKEPIYTQIYSSHFYYILHRFRIGNQALPLGAMSQHTDNLHLWKYQKNKKKCYFLWGNNVIIIIIIIIIWKLNVYKSHQHMLGIIVAIDVLSQSKDGDWFLSFVIWLLHSFLLRSSYIYNHIQI